MTLYEELSQKGINPNKLTLYLAMTIGYDRVTDEKIGVADALSYPVEIKLN